MRSTSGDTVSRDKLTVIGPVTPPGGVALIEVDITREGAPWRKEFYAADKSAGISLTAVQDETSPLIVFSGPVPLLRYGFKEGDEWTWAGSARIGAGNLYKARSVSCVSTVDALTTAVGKLTICRIDTIVAVVIDGHPIHFPSVRWLAPGVGFARRDYAEKGKLATSAVTQVHIR